MQTIPSTHFLPKLRPMSDSIDTPRPGLVTRAKNANQRPGKILTNGRRRRRTPAQMAADKKAAKKKAVVVAAKNVDIEAKKAAITRRVAQLEGAHLKESTVGKSTTAIEPPHSDGVGLGRQTLSAVRAAQILKRTKAHSELTPADVESTTSTTHGPQMYDIVAIAQMVVAGLASPRRKVTRDPISIEVQSYAFRLYYSH